MAEGLFLTQSCLRLVKGIVWGAAACCTAPPGGGDGGGGAPAALVPPNPEHTQPAKDRERKLSTAWPEHWHGYDGNT